MWLLFKAEVSRFRAWAIGAAVAHLILLGFMSRVIDLAQQPPLIYRAAAVAYALVGVLLGLYQMSQYRKPSAWLHLLHRPLPYWRVGAAVGTACLALLACAVGLPIAIAAAVQDLFTTRVVDLRHYGLAVAAVLVASCGYCVGAYALLGGRRYAAFALVLFVLLWTSRAGGLGALAVQAIALAWAAGLLLIAFEPDRTAPPRHPIAVAVTALCIQLGAYVALLVLAVGLELVWIAEGSHPLQAPRAGGLIEARHSDGAELLEAGLRAPVRESDVVLLYPRFTDLPRRHELTNIASIRFRDPVRRVRWIFSHDSMRFEGARLADHRAVGSLGIGDDSQPFPVPPLPLGELWAAGNIGYRYDDQRARMEPRVVVPAGEIITAASAQPVGGRLLVLTDRALYGFDAQTPALRLALPGPIGDLDRVDLIARDGGYLVSFLYLGDAYQLVVRIDARGAAETITRRTFVEEWPALWRYHAWWPSPVLAAIYDGSHDLLAGPAPLRAHAPIDRPSSVAWIAAGVALLSLIAGAWRVRRISLAAPARWAWIAACGALGLPALISLWLLYSPSDDGRGPSR